MQVEVTKELLFQTMHELYESLTTAGTIPNDGINVQTSGKGDPDYMMQVVLRFHHEAGDNWEAFCEFYTPTGNLPDKFVNLTRGRLSGFWRRLRNKNLYRQSRNLVERYLDKAA